jgi:SAM-dependent methyltransferase
LGLSKSAYMRKRFSGSQAILNAREQSLVADMLRQLMEPPRHVLDMPSGHGRFTHQLRAAAQEQLVCADLRKNRLDALVAEEPEAGTPIATRTVDIFSRTDLPDAAFDLVFNFRFFHHVNDATSREHVVDELVRVARRYIIVSYYDTVSVHALQKRIWRHKGHKRRLPMVPRSEFLELFKKRGCEVIDDRGVLPGIHAHRIALLERIMTQ